MVGVAGGSGSGKTTLAATLLDHYGKDRCGVICQDSYYLDQSANFTGDGSVNFDHPMSLDFDLMAQHLSLIKRGEIVEIPRYNFSTHQRAEETQTFVPKDLVLVDGILILSQDKIRPHLDDTIFIDLDEETRFKRRLQRDVQERGRTPEGVEKQFLTHVKPMHDKFVEPSKVHASLCLLGSEPVEIWREMVIPLIDEMLSGQ